MEADGEMFTAEIDRIAVLISELCLHAIDGSQGHG